MEKAQIEAKVAELENQLKTIEVNYHRVSGAIALLKELLQPVVPPEPVKE